MPKEPKRILLRLEVKEAIRTRKCTANKNHKIAPGEKVLEVKAPGPVTPDGYCSACAHRMLAKASDTVDDIKANLTAPE